MVNLTFQNRAGNIIGYNDKYTTNLMHATSAGLAPYIHLPVSLEFPGLAVTDGSITNADKVDDDIREEINTNPTNDAGEANGEGTYHDNKATAVRNARVIPEVNPGVDNMENPGVEDAANPGVEEAKSPGVPAEEEAVPAMENTEKEEAEPFGDGR